MTMSLDQYRKRLEGVESVNVALVHEILDAAESEIDAAHGEYTLAQAVAISGRSRSWFERRLPDWAARGLARKVGVWLIKRAVVPDPRGITRGGFDPSMSADDIADELLRTG